MKIPLTVGLFTYNRPNYLERQLNFFDKLGKNFRLLILDGSESASNRQHNLTLSKKYKSEYISEVSYQNRHLILNEKLDTDFLAYAADDDLILPSFYKKGVDFLKENKEYQAVGGDLTVIEYWKKHPNLGFFFRDHYRCKFDVFLGDFIERTTRVEQASEMGGPPIHYGVKRAEAHQLFSKYVSSLKMHSSIERLSDICILLLGGIKILDTLMGFRDHTSENFRAEDRDDPNQYICNEDIEVLKKVIHTFLINKAYSQQMIDYALNYAWHLPLRKYPIQFYQVEKKPTVYRGFECIYNRFFGHMNQPHNRNVNKLLRQGQKFL